MDEARIATFWHDHPCGDEMVGGMNVQYRGDAVAFFDEYDRFKYSLETHIPACLDGLDLHGKRVLEIGLGQGAESEQLIRRGAIWSGLDLTSESVDRVRTRLAVRGLTGDVQQGSVLQIPWADATFDLVFSHGVLHHVPEIGQAESEIRRVLKPDGELVAMLYARRSLNYLLSIYFLRRVLLLLVYPFGLAGWRLPDQAAAHVENARSLGLVPYLEMDNFLGPNTDGPGNPFSRVYDRRSIERDFPSFVVRKTEQHFMHAPPLPVHGLPGERYLGWHLWAHLAPRGPLEDGQESLAS